MQIKSKGAKYCNYYVNNLFLKIEDSVELISWSAKLFLLHVFVVNIAFMNIYNVIKWIHYT